MNNYKDFHHYTGKELTPSEKVERKVVELLLNSHLPDTNRESSIIWEIKHSSGCCQIARILAQKRNLDADIATAASVLHDIYVIVEGKYKDHAKLGAPIAKIFLREVKGFSEDNIKTITDAVAHHSEKEIYSEDPFVELIKDVDVFDCSLYKNSEGYYRLHKPEEIVKEYIKRIEKVRKELNLPTEPIFR